MTVDTQNVPGRRTVHYASFDDLLADAERLAAGDVRMVGNWSLGQVLMHLATAYEMSIDGFPSALPALIRFMIRMTMKKRFLTKTMPAGFNLPSKATALIPDETDAATGCKALRRAVDRLGQESKRVPNPGLGTLTTDEWNQFHLRHAELHMSFAVPAE